MANPFKLYQKYTMQELLERAKKIESDPKNQMPRESDSIYLYTIKARKKLADISWAITFHLADKKKEASVNASVAT